MNCERPDCGHPLAVHNPCSMCSCPGYEPDDQKMRVAMLTDVTPGERNATDPRLMARTLRGNRTYSTEGKPTK